MGAYSRVMGAILDGYVPLARSISDHVAARLGGPFRPGAVRFISELPKTRSGKIMRRLLKDVSEQRTLGDTTTLADPTVVEEIKDRATAEAGNES